MDCKPLSSKPAGTPRWKTSTIEQQLSHRGGYCNKNMPVISMTIENADGSRTSWLKIGKCQTWLSAAATGVTVGLKRCMIFDTLAGEEAAKPLDVSPKKVVGPAATGEDYDPMDAVECEYIDDTNASPAKASGRAYKRKRPTRDGVASIEVDAVPKCADPKNKARRTVRVLTFNKAIYIERIDVPWLLTYLADEVSCGGVVCGDAGGAAGAGSAIAEPNTDVPGLRIIWDFEKNGWHAKFVSGPLANSAHEFSVSPAKLTEETWNALACKQLVSGAYSMATSSALDKAALAFLTGHCKRILDTQGQQSEPNMASP